MKEKLECIKLAIEYVKHGDNMRGDGKYTTKDGIISIANQFYEFISNN